MLSEEEIKEVEKAKSNILRGNDIESAALILEKVIWDNLIIVGGGVDITKVAVRQILNFIEEYKDKGYLDVVKEKVKANEEITKLQKENEYWKNKFEKELEDNRKNSCELLKQDLVIREKNKQIDLMSEYIYNTQMECNIYYKDKEEVKNKFAKM